MAILALEMGEEGLRAGYCFAVYPGLPAAELARSPTDATVMNNGWGATC